MRFSSPSALAGRVALCPGAAGPADDPASAFSPATPAPCGRTRVGGTRPCGFTLRRLRRGGAVCGGRAGVGVPTGSVGSHAGLVHPRKRPTARRPVAQLSRRRVDRPCGRGPENPARRAHERPDHTPAPPLRSRARHGSCTVAHVARCSATRAGRLSRPGRASRSFPQNLARRRSWGSTCPSQICSRRPGDSASPWNRARVPFVPPRPPRLFFVGVTDPSPHRGDPAEGSVGDKDASASGLQLPSAVRVRNPFKVPLRIDPALGFSSRRVAGHVRRASGRIRLRPGSPASGDERRSTAVAFPNPLMGFRRPSRHDMPDRRS